MILGSDDKGPNENTPLMWNIDASYVVHNDMKSHIGACLLLGTRAILLLLCKQKYEYPKLCKAIKPTVDDGYCFTFSTMMVALLHAKISTFFEKKCSPFTLLVIKETFRVDEHQV